MSDVTVAPAGGAPSLAPSNEVPINPNPTQTPTPIGQQAPDKPVEDLKGSEHRPQSRREAIQKAFDRASNPQPKEKTESRPAPKAAEAKPGHNKPPPDKAEQKPEEKPPQHREQGRFAKPPDAQQAAQHQEAAQRPSTLPENAAYRDPPPRMAEHAKRDWAAAPESVRGEVHRMQNEFEGAYRAYRGDHETMNSIRHFHQMATEHGTTLDRALSNYVAMEQKLRQDVVGGLDVIINNLNLRTPDGQKLGLRDVAYHILNQSPEQHRLVQNQNAQSAQGHQIGQLHQMVNSLAQNVQQMHLTEQFRQTRSAVDQFAEDHPRFDELGDLIENELKFGFDLETAYRRAELLRPGTQAAQTRTPSAQTRPIDRSISGAPDVTPSNGASKRNGKPVGRREAIQNAIKRVNGGL